MRLFLQALTSSTRLNCADVTFPRLSVKLLIEFFFFPFSHPYLTFAGRNRREGGKKKLVPRLFFKSVTLLFTLV